MLPEAGSGARTDSKHPAILFLYSPHVFKRCVNSKERRRRERTEPCRVDSHCLQHSHVKFHHGPISIFTLSVWIIVHTFDTFTEFFAASSRLQLGPESLFVASKLASMLPSSDPPAPQPAAVSLEGTTTPDRTRPLCAQMHIAVPQTQQAEFAPHSIPPKE